MSDRLYLRGTCELLFERATPDSIIQIDKSLENYSFSVSNNRVSYTMKLCFLSITKLIVVFGSQDFRNTRLKEVNNTLKLDGLAILK